MRIDLLEPDGGRRRRKGRRRRSPTFDVAVVQPRGQAQGGRSVPRSRPAGQRKLDSRSKARERTARAEAPGRPRTGWRTFWMRLPGLLLLAGLVAVLVYLSTDGRFFVYDYRVQIVGVRHLDADAIYRVSGVDKQHIFWIRPQEVARAIAQMPGVKAVRVGCGLPAQVAIEVEEREPVVMWRAVTQNRDWWLDEEGVVLPYHGDVQSPEVIFVVDSSPRYLQVGDRITPEGVVQSVRQLAAALPGVRIFFYDADRGLSFTQQTAAGQWPVYVGDGQDVRRKIQVVQALNDYLTAHGIQPRYVDVRWADHPVYGKPAQSSGEGN